jgi:hypothetical protein
MEPDLERKFQNWGPYERFIELKGMYHHKVRDKRYAISQDLLDSKMFEESSVSAHVIKLHSMSGSVGRSLSD